MAKLILFRYWNYLFCLVRYCISLRWTSNVEWRRLRHYCPPLISPFLISTQWLRFLFGRVSNHTFWNWIHKQVHIRTVSPIKRVAWLRIKKKKSDWEKKGLNLDPQRHRLCEVIGRSCSLSPMGAMVVACLCHHDSLGSPPLIYLTTLFCSF